MYLIINCFISYLPIASLQRTVSPNNNKKIKKYNFLKSKFIIIYHNNTNISEFYLWYDDIPDFWFDARFECSHKYKKNPQQDYFRAGKQEFRFPNCTLRALASAIASASSTILCFSASAIFSNLGHAALKIVVVLYR